MSVWKSRSPVQKTSVSSLHCRLLREQSVILIPRENLPGLDAMIKARLPFREAVLFVFRLSEGSGLIHHFRRLLLDRIVASDGVPARICARKRSGRLVAVVPCPQLFR